MDLEGDDRKKRGKGRKGTPGRRTSMYKSKEEGEKLPHLIQEAIR